MSLSCDERKIHKKNESNFVLEVHDDASLTQDSKKTKQITKIQLAS